MSGDLELVTAKARDRQKVFLVTALTGGSQPRIRSAVFAECSGDGIRIQPQGTRFSKSVNVAEQRLFLSIVGTTSYVVFLIRPDGFESFFRYRNLVQSESRRTGRYIDVGYEPVDQDWVLIYPGQEREAYASSGAK